MKKFLILLFLLAVMLPVQKVFADEIEHIHDTPNIHIFKIDLKELGHKIKPYVVCPLDSVKNVYNNNEFDFVVNGGFFDPATAAAASYVVIDGKKVEDPYDNPSLVQKFSDEEMYKIANRSEFRILENKKGKLRFDIAEHNCPTQGEWTIKHSLQAGPQVYPKLESEKEYFVAYDADGNVIRDSIDALKRRARTAIGLKGNYLYVMIFTKQCAYTLEDVHKFCAKMKLEKAMALDGGGSTSVNYDDVEIYSEEKAGRKVKSFLVIED